MFFQKELEFLGHHISSEGSRPTTSQLKLIQEIPAPVELQSFLGI